MLSWVFGSPGTYVLSTWLFLRLLGLIYLVAFASIGTQFLGLVGSRGILPAADFLKTQGAVWGSRRFRLLPTLCWWGAGDGFLLFLCWGGAALSLLLVAGVAPALVAALLWAFYLSLLAVGRIFLGYQWDVLLLETGFLGVFLAPLEILPTWPPGAAPNTLALGLAYWLLFRLMFSSGAVKLLSGDLTWRRLTALCFHYETQPLPTPLAWYAHQLPVFFHRISTVLMFVIELGAPLLIFLPRPFPYLAGALILGLMLLIMATGNYCFFNLNAIALCMLLFDDAVWLRLLGPLLPRGATERIAWAGAAHAGAWPGWAVFPAAAIVLLLSLNLMAHLLGRDIRWPRPIRALIAWLQPFRIVNPYGLFAVMTTSRPEIVVEGSNDGLEWRPYEFKWKPGELRRAPAYVAPHQPRLDWQMWFAAFQDYRDYPWFVAFLARLLEGSPTVLALLRDNPFAGEPPRFVRAVLFEYQFTSFATRRSSGAWWRREQVRLYCPVFAREAGRDALPPS